jgi:nucleoside-diphosphate-sugar epimerase
MHCLLTGASGFLGRILFEEFRKSHIVSTLSRNGSDFNVSLDKEIPIFDLYFDIVVHCAGKAHIIEKNSIEDQEFYKVNVQGTRNLLNALVKSGIPKYFVFISSVSVYGLNSGVLINENTSLLAKDAYGKSKIEAEKVVLEWCGHHNVVCSILRLPLIAGSNPPGNLRLMINGIKKWYYFNIGGGNARKSIVLADDVAKTIFKIKDLGGVYNLTDRYNPTIAEISDYISINLGARKVRSIPYWIIFLFAKIGDLPFCKLPINTIKLKKLTTDLTFDDSKAVDAFGWSPSPVLNQINIFNI